MKKIIKLFLLLSVCFVSCSTTDDAAEIENEQKELTLSDIEGVWVENNYFISISSDGYYISYLSNEFIDCGTVKIEYDTNLPFLNISGCPMIRDTRISIREITKTTMTVRVTSTDINGYPFVSSFNLTKTDDQPTKSNHILCGRTIRPLFILANFGKTTYTFSTANTGMSMPDDKTKSTMGFFYVYKKDRMYYQWIPSNVKLNYGPVLQCGVEIEGNSISLVSVNY